MKPFKRQCPSCQANDKIILRCPICFKLTCSSCSINVVCIDCYVDSKLINEVDNYFLEKYGVKA